MSEATNDTNDSVWKSVLKAGFSLFSLLLTGEGKAK